jgi:hypothetical protein
MFTISLEVRKGLDGSLALGADFSLAIELIIE